MFNHGQHFGFEIPESLYEKSCNTISEVLQGGSAAQPGSEVHLNKAIVETLTEITEVGFQAYYEKPRDLVSMSPVIKKAADAGINAVRKGVQIVIKKVFTRTPLSELQVLARYMSDRLTYDENASGKRHFITFPLTDELFELSQRLLARVREDSNVEEYRKDIINSLIELIDAGVGAYYHEPVNMISLGKLTRKTADVGISTAQKGSNAVVNRLFKVMPHEEMIPLSAYFESLLHSQLRPSNAA